MPETNAKPPATFVNELLDNRLSTTSVRVTNTAAQTTKTTIHPTGGQHKGK
jgi:hypothetical protein